jgi:hypothetical protein
MKKLSSLLIVIFLITSCATQSVISSSIEEKTLIVLKGNLLGLKLQLEDRYIQEIKSNDVQKDKSQRGAGIYDKVLSLEVSPGNHTVILSKDGVIIYKEKVYLLKGQVKTISI